MRRYPRPIGPLCFYGEWFGGRPYDNEHTLLDVRVTENAIALTFDEGEKLIVWEPDGVSVAADGLHIARASRVRSEWFYYGRSKVPANRFAIDYRVADDGTVSVTDTADWYEPRHSPNATVDALAFLKPATS